MRLARTDLVPVLTIIAGGVVGALLTFSPLLLFGPSDNVPAFVQPVQSPAKAAPAAPRPVPVWSPRPVPVWSTAGTSVVYQDANGRVYRVRAGGGEPQPVAISPDGEWIAYQSQPLIYVDGVRIGTSLPESLDSDEVESVEVLKGDAAAVLYGEEASAGVIRIRLKEPRQRR